MREGGGLYEPGSCIHVAPLDLGPAASVRVVATRRVGEKCRRLGGRRTRPVLPRLRREPLGFRASLQDAGHALDTGSLMMFISYNTFIAFILLSFYISEENKEVPMTMLAHRQMPPSAKDAAIARASGQLLSRFTQGKTPLTLRVRDANHDEPLELPEGAVELLMDILEAMAAGRGVTLIPENAELTTVQAAEILNVSRPFLIRLLDENTMPHRKVGKHRRIRMEDVMAYKANIDSDREAVLDQLAAEAQQQDMGYSCP